MTEWVRAALALTSKASLFWDTRYHVQIKLEFQKFSLHSGVLCFFSMLAIPTYCYFAIVTDKTECLRIYVDYLYIDLKCLPHIDLKCSPLVIKIAGVDTMRNYQYCIL